MRGCLSIFGKPGFVRLSIFGAQTRDRGHSYGWGRTPPRESVAAGGQSPMEAIRLISSRAKHQGVSIFAVLEGVAQDGHEVLHTMDLVIECCVSLKMGVQKALEAGAW